MSTSVPVTNRSRGDYFERQTRAALEARGWIVIRAAGSHGHADLWAARAGPTLWMVSCKITRTVTPYERATLCADALQVDALPVVATRTIPGHVDLWNVTTERVAAHRFDRIKVREP